MQLLKSLELTGFVTLPVFHQITSHLRRQQYDSKDVRERHRQDHHVREIKDGAEIGDGSMVWVNVQIREGATVGKKCVLSKDVYVDCNVKIGDECKIQNSVSIYDGVTIESQVFVGPNASFTNDKVPRAFNTDWKITKTLVQQGASLGANCTII